MKNFTLSLYAFHLCHTLIDAPDEVTPDTSKIWDNLALLPGLKDLKSHLICYSNGVYNPKLELGRVNEWLTKLQQSLSLESFFTREDLEIISNLQAFRLNDTYAADLTLSPEFPDINIEVSRIPLFNPDGCLLPTSIHASLGQTLWLYGEIARSDGECKELATDCAKTLLEGTDFSLIPVNQGKLLGSLLFEYEAIDPGDPQNPTQHCHILVWLNNHQASTIELAGKAYDELRDLLYCRHKIRYANYQARLSYQDARSHYSKLEQQGQTLKQLPDTPEERLKQLKRSLSEVSTQIFTYDSHLRDLHAHQTTIETNAINYEQCLKSLPTLPDDDLSGWQNFLKKDCSRYFQQIQTDLNYLKPGRELFGQLTATIRGISEIEQVESDHQNLLELQKKAEQEKDLERQKTEREKNLENTIKILGVGVATGTSTASATAIGFGRVDKDPLNLPFHPFLVSLFLSLSLGFLVGGLSAWLLKIRLDKENEKARNVKPN